VHRPLNGEEYRNVSSTIGSPNETFNNLSTKDQDKYFGKENAKEIRAGESVQTVVNRQSSGMSFGRRLPAKTAITQQNGAQLRDVMKQAGGDRARAQQLLRDRGIIRPQVNPN
jgi:phage protein D